jgi:hypothetical protein
MNFFHIIREYRSEMKMIFKNARNDDHNQVNVILHDKIQDQVDQSGQDTESQSGYYLESGHNHESGHCLESGHEDEKFKDRKCVCDEMHLFKKCFYLVTSTRKHG